MKQQRIKVMLPSYNEEQNLPSLLSRLESTRVNSGLNMEVLVVNDGSKDSTPDIARNFTGDISVRLLDLQPNRGLAGAMREGFKEALKDLDDTDILIALDADDSHNPGLMQRMVMQMREGSDVVIASRYRTGSRIVGLTKFREFLSSGAGYLFRIFTPIRGVRDYTCGYRAYRVGLLREAHTHYGDQFIQQQGFGCMAEILLKLRRFKPIIHEVPFILRYDLKKGSSKMKVMKTVRQTLGLIFGTGK
ncbi:MAG: glycosyltransferase [Flavobacteriales bacterium]